MCNRLLRSLDGRGASVNFQYFSQFGFDLGGSTVILDCIEVVKKFKLIRPVLSTLYNLSFVIKYCILSV